MRLSSQKDNDVHETNRSLLNHNMFSRTDEGVIKCVVNELQGWRLFSLYQLLLGGKRSMQEQLGIPG